MSDFQLAVCSEMVFTDVPIIDRVRRIHDMGFAVETTDAVGAEQAMSGLELMGRPRDPAEGTADGHG